MLDPNGRRQLVIPDHLWATLERMSRELGSPVEALVNQAIAAYARSHGYGTTPTAPRCTRRSPRRARRWPGDDPGGGAQEPAIRTIGCRAGVTSGLFARARGARAT